MLKPYIVFSNPRAGTNLFKHLMLSHDLGFPSEISPKLYPIATVEDLDLTSTRDNYTAPVWSRTLWYYLLKDFIKTCKTLKNIPDHTPDKTALRSAFPELKFIYLYRKDTLRQSVSMAKAQQTDVWLIPQERGEELTEKSAKTTYNKAQIDAALAEIQGYEKNWEAWFEKEGIQPLRVTYEQCVANPKHVIGQVAKLINADIEFSEDLLEAVKQRKSYPVKQADATTNEWVKRYKSPVSKPKVKPKRSLATSSSSLMRVSVLTQEKWTDTDAIHHEPQIGQGGGGMLTKYINVKKCLANAHFTNDFADADMQPVILVEPMLFHSKESPLSIEDKITALKAHEGVKLLWCEEQCVFRWKGELREKIFQAFDAILACNKYQAQLLKVIVPSEIPIRTLYTPIDSDLFTPTVKKRQIVHAGKIGLQKNTDTLIALYEKLKEKDIRTVYIGNGALWGSYLYEQDKEIEYMMSNIADEYIATASITDTAEIINASLAGVSMTIYDVGSLFFLESATAGCHFFAWKYHPLYDEYENIVRFDNVPDAVVEIEKAFENISVNRKLEAEISQKHSFEAFQNQLKHIVMDCLFYA